MAVALAIGGWMGVRLGIDAFRDLRAPSYTTPMDRTMHLSPGRWSVFERTGSQVGGGGFTFTENGIPDLAPTDVTVQDSSGASVPTFPDDQNETINRNGAIYTGAVAFHIASGGSYRITVSNGGAQVIVARSLFDGLGPTLVTLFICVFFFLAAIVVLLISLIVRARRRRRMQPYGPGPNPPPPPPGPWGPPPPGPWPGPPAPGWGAPPPPGP